MADYGTFKVGNVVYPLTNDITNSLLQDANPAVFHALSYFTSMLNIHMGARWDAVVDAAGLDELIGKVVAYNLPFDPIVSMRESQIKFPLLALWESESETSEKTFSWYQTVGTWRLTYSLPSLTSAQTEQIYPFLKAARDIIIDRSEQGYDPNYNNNQQIWSDGYGGVAKVKVLNSKFSNLQVQSPAGTSGSTNLYLPTLMITFEVTYRENFDNTSLETLDGADLTQQLDAVDFIEQKIDFA